MLFYCHVIASFCSHFDLSWMFVFHVNEILRTPAPILPNAILLQRFNPTGIFSWISWHSTLPLGYIVSISSAERYTRSSTRYVETQPKEITCFGNRLDIGYTVGKVKIVKLEFREYAHFSRSFHFGTGSWSVMAAVQWIAGLSFLLLLDALGVQRIVLVYINDCL